MGKIYRIMGKRGRTTIPYAIRVNCHMGPNDLLSFELADKDTIMIRKEKVCGGMQSDCVEESRFSLEEFLESLPREEKRRALLYLSNLMAFK